MSLPAGVLLVQFDYGVFWVFLSLFDFPCAMVVVMPFFFLGVLVTSQSHCWSLLLYGIEKAGCLHFVAFSFITTDGRLVVRRRRYWIVKCDAAGCFKLSSSMVSLCVFCIDGCLLYAALCTWWVRE
ncbi:hypothetical protein P153DRAFT_85615 [Dothidotthia symphoricarpi CBS 119687]|uniref:Uncharacterized protein n=1 Tax=Dothidotthia symphoricarpi CBS 119687 TaxID=1392245 RepID=A0A6A6A2T9_9PLEO|nr:uncharacterized protein P153DRAFT_85615 [Dothidotthia symphoricarpi CBS 119687]KAF2126120.1 hypothetical protein P153DRAFT_85615 [Dothidotthia symphoricarpi CBS 119687]